jgi:hypothetical protein
MNEKDFCIKIRTLMHPVGQNIKYCCFELFKQTNQFGFTYILCKHCHIIKSKTFIVAVNRNVFDIRLIILNKSKHRQMKT